MDGRTGLGRFGGRLLPVWLLLALAVTPVRAQWVRAFASEDSVTVGQRFLLALVVERPPEVQPLFPDEVPGAAVDDATGRLLLGDLEVIARKARRGDIPGTAAGVVRDSVIYEVATFALDTARVPAIPVRFISAEADTFTIASAPFMVAVASLVPPDAGDIRDLAPLATFSRLVWQWVLLGLVISVVALLALVARRRAPARAVVTPPSVPLSPYQEATRRLHRLETVDLTVPEAVKPFYVELSEVVRTYLAHRLRVPAMELTTRELVESLREQVRRERVEPGVPGEVHDVLVLADFAKFADARPAPAQGRQMLEKARATLHLVEMHRERAEAGDTAPGPDGVAPRMEVAVPEAPPPKRWPAIVAGGVAGLALGLYGGVPAVMLLGLSGAYYLGGLRLLPAEKRPLCGTFALQAGLYTFLLGSYVLAPEQVALPLLAMAEMLVVVGGLAWLVARPGWPPAGVLSAVHGAGLVITGFMLAGVPGGSAAQALLVVFALVRLGAVVTMVQGVRRMPARSDLR